MSTSRALAIIATLRAELDDLEAAVKDLATVRGDDSPWMTVREYSRWAKVSADTVRRVWFSQGMPHVGEGRLARVHRDEADAWRSARR